MLYLGTESSKMVAAFLECSYKLYVETLKNYIYTSAAIGEWEVKLQIVTKKDRLTDGHKGS